MPSEIQSSIFQNTYDQYFFQQGDGEAARFIAEICGTLNLDPYKIHSIERRERMENTGEYYLDEVISEGVWTSGTQSGKSQNKNLVARSIYRQKVDEFKKFVSLDDQIKLMQQSLLSQELGYAIIRSGKNASPVPIYIPMRRHIWDDLLYSRNPRITMAERKLAQHIEWLKTTEAYQTPAPLEPWKETKKAPGSPKRKRGME